MAPKKSKRIIRRKGKKKIKKVFPKKLRNKLADLAKQQVHASAGPRIVECITQSSNTFDLETETFSTKIKKETVNCRHKALTLLHNHLGSLEVRFQRDILELEDLYAKKFYLPLYALRKKLLDVQPEHQEIHHCQSLLQSCQESFPPGCKELPLLHAYVNHLHSTNDVQPAGPCKEFWLNVLLRADPVVRHMIHPGDMEILKYLSDVKADHVVPRMTMDDSVPCNSEDSTAVQSFNEETSLGYTIRFEFQSNPFFSNAVLYKSYYIDIRPDESDFVMLPHCDVLVHKIEDENDADAEDSEVETDAKANNNKSSSKNDKLLDYSGPQIVSTKGCRINWLELDADHQYCNQDDKQSFFDFFKPIDEKSIDFQENISRDFKIGSYFRDVLIPKAYLFYRRTDLKEPEKPNTEPIPVIPSPGDSEASLEMIDCSDTPSSSQSDIAKNYDDVDDDIPPSMSTQALLNLHTDEAVKNDVYHNNMITETGLAKSRMAIFLGQNDVSNCIIPFSNEMDCDVGTNDVDDEVKVPPTAHSSSHVNVDANTNDVNISDVIVTSKEKKETSPTPSQSASQVRVDPESEIMQSVSESRDRMAKVVNQVNQLLMKGQQGGKCTEEHQVTQPSTGVTPFNMRAAYNDNSSFVTSVDDNAGKNENPTGRLSEINCSLPPGEKLEKIKYEMKDGVIQLNRELESSVSKADKAGPSLPPAKRSFELFKFHDVPSTANGSTPVGSDLTNMAERKTAESTSEDSGSFVMACTSNSDTSEEHSRKSMSGYETSSPFHLQLCDPINDQAFSIKEPKPMPLPVCGTEQKGNITGQQVENCGSETDQQSQKYVCKQQ